MDHHLRATRRVRVFNSPPLLLLVHPARLKPTDNYNSSSSDNRTASRVSSERLLPEPANWTASTDEADERQRLAKGEINVDDMQRLADELGEEVRERRLRRIHGPSYRHHR